MPQNEYSKEGEKKASLYLNKKGYKILEHNYRALKGEIDIICQKRNQIVFVEVKRRSSDAFGEGTEAITNKKMKQIQKIALCYIKARQAFDADYRFDVISILGQDKDDIEHIENAFLAQDSVF